MKYARNLAKMASVALGVCGLAVLLVGCETTDQPEDTKFMSVPGLPGELGAQSSEVFHIGDLVIVTFSGSSGGTTLINPHEERVKENGTITPPFVGSIVAVGRGAGDIQKEIQDKINVLYNHITVTVKPGERFFYVDGEVNRRGPAEYKGDTDIVQAISAAGGLTDWARRSKIKLTHPNGKTEIIDYDRVIDDPGFNVKVYPNDKIYVPRRIL